MRGQRVQIKGINRQIGSSDNNVGFCSEIINLKEQNGVKVVGKKEVKSANIPYSQVKIHSMRDTDNYIGMQSDATGVAIVHFDPSSGVVIKTIKTLPAGHEVYFTTLTNQIVISDITDIKEYVYIYDKEYKLLYDGVDFNFNIDLLQTAFGSATKFESKLSANSKEEFLAGCSAYLNKFEIENKELSEGRFMYAFTVTYYDGTESTTFGLGYANGKHNTGNTDGFITLTSSETGGTNKFITAKFNPQGYYCQSSLVIGENKDFYTKHKDLIKSINLYVSRPISRFPLTVTNVSVSGMGWENDEVNLLSIYIPEQGANESGIEKELLYRQKTWTLEEFCNGQNYVIEFGGDMQTTGATMEVYATNADRAGKMYTYNNRVHFYDSSVRIHPYITDVEYLPYYTSPVGSTILKTARVIVYLKNVTGDLVFRYDGQSVVLDSNGKLILPEMFVYPDSRAYRMDIINPTTNKKYTVSLSSSPAYNYAYAFGGIAKMIEGTAFDGNYPTLVDSYIENDVINVTSAALPMNFPVEYSYLFNGRITAIAVASMDVSAAQVGQYPVNVFTDNGIFALAQGSGEVLYSNIIPVSNETVLNESIVVTKQGIAFIAHDSIYLLQGKDTTNMTLILNGEIDTNIQNNDSFLKCCGGSLYDITDYISQDIIGEYLKEATLSYSPITNELVVSNDAYQYSYIYDFNYNTWYKITGTFTDIEDGLMLTPVGMNEKGATSATGTITLSAIHKESAKSFSSLCYVEYTKPYSCGAGNTVALIIDETQVASATFSQVTYMPMIMAALCDKISYLEDKPGYIYSTTDLKDKIVKVYNITTGQTLLSSTFIQSSEAAAIPNKAIGATVTVTISSIPFTYTFTASSSVVTMLNDLASQINKSSLSPVTAQVNKNNILLTSKNKGAVTNNIAYSATTTDTDYIYINTSGNNLSGGQDISLEPSSYKEIVEWNNKVLNGQTTVHLHTRPLHFDNPNGYKTIKRTVLNCLADLTGSQNLSMYIYASDNLIDWKCVCAAQRKNVSVSQITSDRSAKAYKYFVIMIGGVIPNITQLSDIVLTIEDVAENKLR